MSNYTKVQFISWELYTGPFKNPADAPQGFYNGLSSSTVDYRTDVLGQCWDIEARLVFIADAIAKTYASADLSSSTLKIFMAPEFLCRGAGGAYLHDLLNGWVGPAPSDFALPAPFNYAWDGLFGGLQTLVADARYEDFLFVFGTMISASFPTAEAIDGQYLLDPTKPGEVYNTALIQRGGASHTADNYAARKQYISGIDFLKWSGSVAQHTYHTVLPADPETVIPADVLGVTEGGAVFQIAGLNDANGTAIDFGIEICLDHALSGGSRANSFGRLRTANQWVKIQLVPSGGMGLEADSIRLLPAAGPTPHAYAFNCDGYTTLDYKVFGSHTQIWNGANGAEVPAANKLIEIGGGDSCAGTTLTAVASSLLTQNGVVLASQLWNNGDGVQGAGHVRVIDAMLL
jgi:hypothetical protein